VKTPGITIRRITHLTGRADLCETFFDNVRVPATQMLGPENRGWYVATTTLDFERSGVDRVATGQRVLNDIVAFAREARRDGTPLIAIPEVRYRIADLQIALNVGRLMAYRVAWMQSRGLIPNYEASMSKVYGSTLVQRIANDGTYILGLHGQLAEGDPRAPRAGRIAFAYLHAVQATILAGTSEIQKNIIATRGLGLPRG
jgi:3-oxocholest-4-en-26-oyl-CoA dehydrogenase alpha subunit